MTNYSTYLSLDGRVLDLSALTDEQRAFFARCWQAYQANMPWSTFADLATSPDNPLVRDAGGWVTRIVYDHPLFRAVSDLEDRLGLRQGELAPEEGLNPSRDPLADEWLSVSDAARRKGVSVSAVHQAIARRELVSRPAKSGGSWLVVSANSLAGWTPNPVRQAAARRKRPAALV